MKDETAKRALDLVEKAGTSIQDAVAQLAASLGVAADHVYGVLVRQQVVSGITTIAAASFFAIVLIVLACAWRNAEKKKEAYASEHPNAYRNPHDDMAAVLMICGIGYSVVFLMISAMTVPGAIQKISNPEYFAIKEAAAMISRITGG